MKMELLSSALEDLYDGRLFYEKQGEGGTTLISHTLKERSLYAKVKTNPGFAEDYNMERFLPADPLVLLSTKRFQSSIPLCFISCAPGAFASVAISLLPTNNKRDTIPQPSGSHNSGQRSAPTSM